ncbi:MAG: hypothetical protein WAQ08_00780 [Aquabacterium sp.]|jgi:hypothetical protein|uniref:hypothetical protein n=1 Tax=Aquabacterium sp. TaxID=1872578 RepID=UPI003BAE9CB8
MYRSLVCALALWTDRIIKYADEQGAVARAVLNPARMPAVVAESIQETNGTQQLKAALDAYKPVAVAYAKAFEQFRGQYDEEYLDSFETMFQATLAGTKTLGSIKPEDIKDETMRPMIEAAMKMAAALPQLFLSLLDKQAKSGMFSTAFEPAVQGRMDKLRAAVAAP